MDAGARFLRAVHCASFLPTAWPWAAQRHVVAYPNNPRARSDHILEKVMQRFVNRKLVALRSLPDSSKQMGFTVCAISEKT